MEKAREIEQANSEDTGYHYTLPFISEITRWSLLSAAVVRSTYFALLQIPVSDIGC